MSNNSLIKHVQGHDPEYQQYLDKLSEKKRNRIARQHNGMRHGLHAAAPLTCTGPKKCPFIEHCPIPEKRGTEIHFGPLDDYPIHRPCVMEMLYMQQKIIDYIQHLEVDEHNPIEVAIVNDLALIDLYKNRALMILSSGDRHGNGRDLLRVDITGITEQGQEQTSATLHPAVEMVDRLEKRRTKLMEQLLETRKAKVDTQLKLGAGPADNKIMDALAEVRTLLLESSEPAVDDAPVLIDD